MTSLAGKKRDGSNLDREMTAYRVTAKKKASTTASSELPAADRPRTRWARQRKAISPMAGLLRQRFINLEAVGPMARLARNAAIGRDVLYHGTRFAQSVLTTGVLFASNPGEPTVSFTRSPETASYWALLERNYDEGHGAILIFDRQSLRCRYRVEPYHDVFWDDVMGRNDEAEERVCQRNVVDIGRHLIGIIFAPTVQCPSWHKKNNREFMRTIDVRLKELPRYTVNREGLYIPSTVTLAFGSVPNHKSITLPELKTAVKFLDPRSPKLKRAVAVFSEKKADVP
jgi:hypothetical protein